MVYFVFASALISATVENKCGIVKFSGLLVEISKAQCARAVNTNYGIMEYENIFVLHYLYKKMLFFLSLYLNYE